jgi:hypothetical protein
MTVDAFWIDAPTVRIRVGSSHYDRFPRLLSIRCSPALSKCSQPTASVLQEYARCAIFRGCVINGRLCPPDLWLSNLQNHWGFSEAKNNPFMAHWLRRDRSPLMPTISHSVRRECDNKTRILTVGVYASERIHHWDWFEFEANAKTFKPWTGRFSGGCFSAQWNGKPG